MFSEIWKSYRRLPTWVQIWTACWLGPINLLSLAFLGAPEATFSGLVACLSILGMALNFPIVIAQRGFGNAMAIPHVIFWTPLVILIGYMLVNFELPVTYAIYLVVLLLTDVISLAFDYKETRDWLNGDRIVN